MANMWANMGVAGLQKTYDESYLTCSTAVYYEGQVRLYAYVLFYMLVAVLIRSTMTDKPSI